jgi:hypothetical protein
MGSPSLQTLQDPILLLPGSAFLPHTSCLHPHHVRRLPPRGRDYTAFPEVKRSSLPLSQPHVVWMEYGVRAMHHVDAASPLRAIAERARADSRLCRAFHILATISGTHACTGQTVTR